MKVFNVLALLFSLTGIVVAQQGIISPNDPHPSNSPPATTAKADPTPPASPTDTPATPDPTPPTSPAGTTATPDTTPPASPTTTEAVTIPGTITTAVCNPVTVTVANATVTTTVTVGVNGTIISSAPQPTPVETGVALHPNGNTAKCLDVQGAKFANGTPVQIFDCNGTPAQQWVLQPGRGHVKVAGKNFCLDAGSSPKNGVGMKIWTCFDNLPAQDWFLTGDRRIALFNKGLCLDLTNGLVADSNRIQTWKCTDNDVNQAWT